MTKGARKAVVCGSMLAALLGAAMQPALGRGQTATGSGAVAHPKSVLADARLAYYNLHSRGMASFQCDFVPDWNLVLGDMKKTNPDAAKNLLLLLQQLHFTVSIAADDSLKVTHSGLENVQNPDVINGLSQIYGGLEQMVTGTFQTWNLFMLKTPFPDSNSDFELVDLGPRYQLKFNDAGANVVTTMGHDFAIEKMEVTNPGSESSIGPVLTSTPEGFVLAGFDASYKPQNEGDATKLRVRLEYVKVQGLEMLSRMTVDGTSGSTPFRVALGFSNCQATMK